MPEPVLLLALSAAALAVVFVVAAFAEFGRRSPRERAGSLLLGVVFLLVAALAGTVSVATQGYRALTREEVAATVDVQPVGPRRFRATFSFADGRTDAFELRGDQLYVDAHILKWKPIVNILGLHTAYELDRVAGRYAELSAERDSTRTVFSLGAEKPMDMFRLREKATFLAPILDAEYGSGTFHQVHRPGRFDIRVSTTGLLIRPRDEG